MKKILFFTVAAFFFSAHVRAAEDLAEGARHSLKEHKFMIETDKDTGSDSLNRISGEYETGFSATEQSFDSPDHYRPGPFGREEVMDKQS